MLQVRALSPEPFDRQLELTESKVRVLFLSRSKRQKLQIAEFSGVFVNIRQLRWLPDSPRLGSNPSVLTGIPILTVHNSNLDSLPFFSLPSSEKIGVFEQIQGLAMACGECPDDVTGRNSPLRLQAIRGVKTNDLDNTGTSGVFTEADGSAIF